MTSLLSVTTHASTHLPAPTQRPSCRLTAAAVVAGLVSILLLIASVGWLDLGPQQRFLPPVRAAPRSTASQARLSLAPRFRVDPDDIIDVKAEVVDAESEAKTQRAKPSQNPPRGPRKDTVYYEETVYTETLYGQPFQNRPQGNPYADMFPGQPQSEPPWWLGLVPLVPYIAAGLLGLLAVGCLVSGALGWIFSILGCLVVANAIAGFFVGDDDDFRGGMRDGQRPRDPWV